MFSSSLLIPALLLAQSCIAAPQCAKRNGSKSQAGSTTGSKATATGVTRSTISSASASPRPSGVPVVGGGTGNSTRPRGLDFDVSFVLDLDNDYIDSPSITSSSGLTVDADVYIVDMERTTEEKIAEYHADGKTVICYFCAGTWEIGRVDSADFDPACFCADGEVTEDGCTSSTHKMDDWEEWWLDLHTETCKTDALARMNARMARAKEKGCDGVDPDNVDSYLTKTQKTHGNTIEDEVDYLLKLAQAAHDNGLLIDLKNSAELIRSDQYRDLMVDAFDFSVIESCLKWNECDDYDAFLTAEKPRIQLEYGTLDSCPALKPGAHMLLYSGKTINIGDITKECSP